MVEIYRDFGQTEHSCSDVADLAKDDGQDFDLCPRVSDLVNVLSELAGTNRDSYGVFDLKIDPDCAVFLDHLTMNFHSDRAILLE